MIQPTLKKTDCELTPQLSDYLEKKIRGLGKLVQYKGEIPFSIEVARTTHHHRKGSIFRAEFQMRLPYSLLRSEAVSEDLRKAIDGANKHMEREILKWKGKLVARARRKTNESTEISE